MTVSAQNGQIAFAIQPTEGTKYVYPNLGSATGDGEVLAAINAWSWKYHKALAVSMSPQEFVDVEGPQVGSGLFADTTYKMGAFVGGAVALDARLEDTLGHLLYAAAGDYAATAVTGETEFKVKATDDSSLPWLSLKRYIPGDSTITGQLEYFINCRVAALTITIPQMGLLRTEFTFVGQKPLWADPTNAENIKMVAAYEDGDSLALACKAGVVVPGLAAYLPASGGWTGAQIILSNGFTTPQQEMILGSYYPDDFMPIARGAVIRLIYKWKDAALYRALFQQSVGYGTGTEKRREWNAIPATSDVTITAKSAAMAAGVIPYMFTFTAPNVTWTMSPPVLAPAQMLQVEVIGTIQQSNGGSTWTTKLQNFATYSF